MTKQRFLVSILTIAGSIAVAVGSYLQWFWIDPRFDPLGTTFPRAYGSLAETGISGVDFVLLGSLGVVILFYVARPESKLSIIATVLTGTGILLYCVYYPIASPWIGFHAMAVPATGWFLTTLGSTLLIGSVLLRLQPRENDRTNQNCSGQEGHQL